MFLNFTGTKKTNKNTIRLACLVDRAIDTNMKKISAGNNNVAAPVLLTLLLVLSAFTAQTSAQRTALRVGFYTQKCGFVDVESIVRTVVNFRFAKDPSLVAALLRLQFHDCFVNVL